MYTDYSGYLTDYELAGGIALGIATVVLVAAIACSGGTVLIAISGIAVASGGGQIISNLANGENLLQNTLGATVGGAFTGMSIMGGGLLVCTAGGTINAFLNEVENVNREGRLFNRTDFLYESIYYSTLNYLTRFAPGLSTIEVLRGVGISFATDAGGYTASDGFLKDIGTYIIDYTAETIKGIREGYIYYD